MKKIRLEEIAYARSGDKGNSANIGIIAYTPTGYQFLEQELTSKRVGEFMRRLKPMNVVRYELPNLGALNFVCLGVLAGGASLSLRSDTQGKALGQALLDLPLEIPEDIFPHCIRGTHE